MASLCLLIFRVQSQVETWSTGCSNNAAEGLDDNPTAEQYDVKGELRFKIYELWIPGDLQF